MMLVAAGLLGAAAPARASIVFDRAGEIWISADDGSGARRLAQGREPHIAPGGATVLYRSYGGSRVYAVPAAGGPRRRLLTLRRSERLPTSVPLTVDFATGGRYALVGSSEGNAHVADLATGAVRRVDVPAERGHLSPDGSQLVWESRRRACGLEILDLASGRLRSLARHLCGISVEWGLGGIALVELSVDQSARLWRSRVTVLDPRTGARRLLLSLPRLLRLAEPGRSGAWRLGAARDRLHAPAAWLVRPDGRPLARSLPGEYDPAVFGDDDRSVFLQRVSGALTRIDLATGTRRRVGSSDLGFDAG